MSGFGYYPEFPEDRMLIGLFAPIFAALTFILSVLARIRRFGKTLIYAFSILMVVLILLPVVIFGYDKKHRKLIDMVLPIYLAAAGLFFFVFLAYTR